MSLFLKLRNMLAEPRLAGIDPDGEERIVVHRRVLQEKPMLQQVFRDVESEFIRVLRREQDAGTDHDDLPMAMRVAVRGTPEEIRELRGKLEEWLEHCSSTCDEREDSDDLVSWSGFVAFYPQAGD